MLTEAEMQRYRSALYGVAAAVGHAPRMSLAGQCPAVGILQLTPNSARN